MNSVMLTVGLLLVACAGEFFHAGSIFLAASHLPYNAAMPFILFTVGGGLVLENQRRVSP